jgi:hypothetical protein
LWPLALQCDGHAWCTGSREAEAKWPGLTDYLNRTGLGSDPRLIQKLAARAEHRPERRCHSKVSSSRAAAA